MSDFRNMQQSLSVSKHFHKGTKICDFHHFAFISFSQFCFSANFINHFHRFLRVFWIRRSDVNGTIVFDINFYSS